MGPTLLDRIESFLLPPSSQSLPPLYKPPLTPHYPQTNSPTSFQQSQQSQQSQSQSQSMEDDHDQALIPGLPDDIAIDIIARVPHLFLPSLRPISRRFHNLVSSPSFLRHRLRINTAETLIFLVQSHPSPPPSKDPNSPPPSYTLSLHNSTTNTWHRLSPPFPIPLFAHIAAVGSKLLLIGGWDPSTLNPLPDVKILDLATGEWKSGKPMTTARSFFACAAADGRVFAAGGHDAMKNALRTAEIYDVAGDEWFPAPAMAEERDECRGVTIRGRFWAVSGYGTERQGRFGDSAEWFDEPEGVWRKEEIAGEDGGAAAWIAGEEGLWRLGSRGAPEGMAGGGGCAAAMGGGRAFVMAAAAGDGGGGGGYGGWVLDMVTGKWTRVETPAMFSGFAYSAVAVRI